MKYGFDWTPDFDATMQSEVRRGERAVTRGIRAAEQDLKSRWRNQIRQAGLGRKLANTIRSKSYPGSAESLGAAAVVWSKAPHIVGAYEHGVTIRASDGFWLAIPTEAAGRARGGRRMTPGDWERQNGIRLRFVYRPGQAALLVADDARTTKKGLARQKRGRRRKDGILTGAQTVVVFVLVPQAKLKKRLNLERAAQQVAGNVPGLIGQFWRN
jgi:hypothetical protein